MLGPSFPLRLLSDDILQELDPTRTDRHFEWRRDFNIINFVLTNPRVQLSYQLNDLALFLGDRDAAASRPLVNAGAGPRMSIQGAVQRLDRGDTFFHTRRTPGDDPTLFETFPAQGSLQVEISACDPVEGDDIFGPGTYPGMLLAWDPKHEADTLTLDLRAPASALKEIADSLQSGNASAIALRVGIRVFTYEVDDALREPYHRQTFVCHGHGATAAILDIRTLPAALAPVPEDEAEPAPLQDPSPPASRTPPSPGPELRSLATPLWVIAGLLLLFLMTN